MHLTGSLHQGHAARPAVPAAAGPAAVPHEAAAPAARFSMISTISPGSLARAYQALRGLEAGPAPKAVAGGDPAILSGQGIPAALRAYGEAIEGR